MLTKHPVLTDFKTWVSNSGEISWACATEVFVLGAPTVVLLSPTAAIPAARPTAGIRALHVQPLNET